MKNDWLDRGLNDKLGDYESPLNGEDAWAALQAKRQPKKKRRFFFIWWMFGLLIAGGIGGYFLWEKQNTSVAIDLGKTTILEKKEMERDVFSKNKNNTSTSSSALSLSPQNSSVSSATENKNNTFTKQDTFIAHAEDSLFVSIEKKKNNTFTKKERTANIEKSNDLVFSNTLNNASSKNGNGSVSNSNFLDSIASTEELLVEKSNPNTNLQNDFSKKETNKLIAFSLLPILEIKNLDYPQTENRISLNNLFTFHYKDDSETPNENEKANLPNYLSLSVAYGMRSKGKVQASEKPLDAISFDLNFEKYFGKYTYLKSGISFQQFTNRINLLEENHYSQLTDNQLITVNHFQNGTIQEIYGTAEADFIEKNDYQIYNRYQFVSIPIIFGVELSPFRKSSIQLEAGVSASIYGKHSGKILAQNPDAFTEELSDMDLKKAGILTGIYGVQWNFLKSRNDALKFSIGYQGNFHFNKISKSEDLDIQKFNFHQINIGMKYNL